ncbi:hypothetical protein BpHYR1_053346 [Brachionus plicatilis]|uniref:Uncharacterized protein n=1 Tax=Brachionus plicatilis TaxID=10195 RepID=A0A3M7QFA7_BRAPC|nr:hypothetical protein BpHYR1_053346 [Brachionus plicatilis]
MIQKKASSLQDPLNYRPIRTDISTQFELSMFNNKENENSHMKNSSSVLVHVLFEILVHITFTKSYLVP